MPCCILGCLYLTGPRFTLFFLWFIGWTRGAFDTHVWPVLGFLFMPFTTLCYACAMKWGPGFLSPLWVVILAIAVVLDILPLFHRQAYVYYEYRRY